MCFIGFLWFCMNWVVLFCCKKSVFLMFDLIIFGCLSFVFYCFFFDVGWFGVFWFVFFLIGSCLFFGIFFWRRMVLGSGLDLVLSCENIWIVSLVSSFFVMWSELKCRIYCGWNIDEFCIYFVGLVICINVLNFERGFCIFYVEIIFVRFF